MYTQRAIRRLKPYPVLDDLTTKLIDAAIRARSGGNRQLWSFVVIRDKSAKQKLGEWYLDAWNRSYATIPKEQRSQFPKAFARTSRLRESASREASSAVISFL